MCLNKMLAKIMVCLLLAVITSGVAFAEDFHLGGKVNRITSVENGLLVMLDSGVPTKCQGTPYGWILIPETNKTMVTLAILANQLNLKYVVIYTKGLVNGVCTATQVDVGTLHGNN
ncbi:MAG: hypothetical protein HQK51_07935 [Oligoflexia bacterium]|nr:hypothetical protein [Oligoflexia bacterium]